MNIRICAVMLVALLAPLAGPSTAQGAWREGVDWKIPFPDEILLTNEWCNNTPLVFELLKDQTFDLRSLLDDPQTLPETPDPTTHAKKSKRYVYRGDYGLSQMMLAVLDDWAQSGIDVDTEKYRLYNTLLPDGTLILKKGFRWDGPSIPFVAGCNPSGWRRHMMRSSAVHDAIYDWMRHKLIDRDPYGKRKKKRIRTQGWRNRMVADTLFYALNRADGGEEGVAEKKWKGLRNVGRYGISSRDIDCPRPHAQAVARETITLTCVPPHQPAGVLLDGRESRFADHYRWMLGDETLSKHPYARVDLWPHYSPYELTLFVSDGNDAKCNPRTVGGGYQLDLRDSTVTLVTLEPDYQSPVISAKSDPIEIVAATGVFTTLSLRGHLANVSDDCGEAMSNIVGVSPGSWGADFFISPDGQAVRLLSDVGKQYSVEIVASDEVGNKEIVEILVETVQLPGDLNVDGVVDCADIAIVKDSYRKRSGEPGFDPRADVNTDGIVSIRDFSFVSRHLPAGTVCPR